jgi:hypothetical protein
MPHRQQFGTHVVAAGSATGASRLLSGSRQARVANVHALGAFPHVSIVQPAARRIPGAHQRSMGDNRADDGADMRWRVRFILHLELTGA